jgi:hypothetical protein
MADHRIDAAHVTAALRGHPADAETREALRVLATGLLRRLKAGADDSIASALAALLGQDERMQCAQRTVDWYREGERDQPPFPERPQMRAAIADVFARTLGRDATATELRVLVNALVGIERDVVLSPGPMARMIIAKTLVDAYAAGGDAQG